MYLFALFGIEALFLRAGVALLLRGVVIQILGLLRAASFWKRLLIVAPVPPGAFGPRACSHLPAAKQKGFFSRRVCLARAASHSLPCKLFACDLASIVWGLWGASDQWNSLGSRGSGARMRA